MLIGMLMLSRRAATDFMLKEIHEQPRVIRDTLAGRLTNGVLSIDELGMSLGTARLISRVYIIACGTSYHAGLIARQRRLGTHTCRS